MASTPHTVVFTRVDVRKVVRDYSSSQLTTVGAWNRTSHPETSCCVSLVLAFLCGSTYMHMSSLLLPQPSRILHLKVLMQPSLNNTWTVYMVQMPDGLARQNATRLRCIARVTTVVQAKSIAQLPGCLVNITGRNNKIRLRFSYCNQASKARHCQTRNIRS